jgi:hypothetical protein
MYPGAADATGGSAGALGRLELDALSDSPLSSPPYLDRDLPLGEKYSWLIAGGASTRTAELS